MNQFFRILVLTTRVWIDLVEKISLRILVYPKLIMKLSCQEQKLVYSICVIVLVQNQIHLHVCIINNMYYNCCCTLQLLWKAGLQIHVLVHVKLTMRKGYSITEPKYLHSKGIGIKMKHAKQNSLIIKIRNRNKKLKFWMWNIGKTFKPGINCRHIIFL